MDIAPRSLEDLAAALPDGQAQRLQDTASRARILLSGRVVWNVNSTATGGGVAELLRALLSYGRGAGVDTRWLVVGGDADFFAFTKRLHLMLHGFGEDRPITAAERDHYRRITEANGQLLSRLIGPQDVVLLHDPQTAGLVDLVRRGGATAVWRCHVGADIDNQQTRQAWSMLRPLVSSADGFVFSRKAYIPDWVPPERVRVISPTIDPLAAKNRPISPDRVTALLRRVGVLAGPPRERPVQDGLIQRALRPTEHSRLVVQVGRWDPLKDPEGVVRGFAGRAMPSDVHLVVAGPDPTSVTDDPDGVAVLQRCRQLQRSLPPGVARRIHLICLPTVDVEGNATIVNALQRRASVVVQKSLAEGFGLTVTEAMWKSRPVLASAVGGIVDQIRDGIEGVLLPDPSDLEQFAAALAGLLADPDRAAAMGVAGHERAARLFLADRGLVEHVDFILELICAATVPGRAG